MCIRDSGIRQSRRWRGSWFGVQRAIKATTHEQEKGGKAMSSITTKDGTGIYYKDWGTGEPVVFSHGWPLNADSWEAQMVFLASHGYRSIAHDRRGHGRSSQPWTGNDMDTYGDDLATLTEALDLKRAHILGVFGNGMAGDCSLPAISWARSHRRGYPGTRRWPPPPRPSVRGCPVRRCSCFRPLLVTAIPHRERPSCCRSARFP